jgi:hypothetical protein
MCWQAWFTCDSVGPLGTSLVYPGPNWTRLDQLGPNWTESDWIVLCPLSLVCCPLPFVICHVLVYWSSVLCPIVIDIIVYIFVSDVYICGIAFHLAQLIRDLWTVNTNKCAGRHGKQGTNLDLYSTLNHLGPNFSLYFVPCPLSFVFYLSVDLWPLPFVICPVSCVSCVICPIIIIASALAENGPLWTKKDHFGPNWTTLDQIGPLWTKLDYFGPLW